MYFTQASQNSTHKHNFTSLFTAGEALKEELIYFISWNDSNMCIYWNCRLNYSNKDENDFETNTLFEEIEFGWLLFCIISEILFDTLYEKKI